MKKILLLITLTLISSSVAQAAGNTITDTFNLAKNLLSLAVGILVTLALAVFFWGLVKYIFKLGGEKAVEGGKRLMIYGVVSLFVMVSVWGLVAFIQQFFGINPNQTQSVDSLLPPLR